MRPEEIRELPVEEVEQRLEETLRELSNLRFQKATHQIDNPLKIRTTRRAAARIRTILAEKRRAAAAAPAGNQD